MRLLLGAALVCGCPAIYSPNLPDLAVQLASDLSVTAVEDLAQPAGVDPCLGACAPGETCLLGCLPPQQPCTGVTCPSGESCFDGVCLLGCVVDRCQDKRCSFDERCTRDGKCRKTDSCDLPCPDGTLCATVCMPADPCDPVRCDPGQTCLRGICVEDPCAGLSCPPPTVC